MTDAATYWRNLMVETVFSPASAARKVMLFRPSREVTWTALLLVGVLNTILFSVTNLMFPTPTLAMLSSPITVLGLFVAELGLSAVGLYWAGRLLNGTGTLGDIFQLMIWLQALRVLIQAVTLGFLVALPNLAIVFVLAANLLSVWILVNFVNVVHELSSLMRSAAVLVVAVIGLSLILSLLGISILGSIIHV